MNKGQFNKTYKAWVEKGRMDYDIYSTMSNWQKIKVLEAIQGQLGPAGKGMLNEEYFKRAEGWAKSLKGIGPKVARYRQITEQGAFKRLSGGPVGAAANILRRPGFSASKFALPGAGVGGVLTGKKAIAAAAAAFQEGESRFGELMGYMGRQGANPMEIVDALRASIGRPGAGEVLWKQTEVGGMLGLRFGEGDKAMFFPTAHGPYMVSPSQDSPLGAAIKVTGTISGGNKRDQLEVTTHIANELRKAESRAHAASKTMRSDLMGIMAALRGGRDDPAVMWNAVGNELDLLKMNRGLVLEAQKLVDQGKYVNIDDAIQAAMVGQKLGYHPLFGKPEAALKQVFPLMSDPSRLFPQLSAAGRPLHQDTVFAGLFGHDVARFEKSIHGRIMPRIRTKQAIAVERALGRTGTQQGVVSKIGQLLPSHPLFRKLTKGDAGIEQVIISKEMARSLRFIDKASGVVNQVGIGTPVKIAGQSMIIGGVMDASQMGGQHTLMAVANFKKHPDRYLEMLYGQALHDALESVSTRNLHVSGIGTFSKKGVQVAGTPGQIVFTPDESLAEHDMGTVMRKMKGAGLHAAAAQGNLIPLLGEVHVRGGMQLQPSMSPMKVKALDIMSMGLTGKHSRKVSRRLISQAQAAGGYTAQSLWSFFSAFEGRPLSSNIIDEDWHAGLAQLTPQGRAARGVGDRIQKFRRLGIGEVSSGFIGRLQNIKTVADLQSFVQSDDFLPYDIALRLPKKIQVPNLYGAKYGNVDVSEIALPSVKMLERMLPRLLKGTQKELADSRAFIPAFAAGVGRLLETAAGWSQALGTSGEGAAEQLFRQALYAGGDDYDGLLKLMTSHVGGNRMLSASLQPALGGKSVYGRIAQGWEGIGLPEVGLGEVGMSASMARRLGFTSEQISQIQSGKLAEYVGQGYWPSITPESQAVKRVRIFNDEEMAMVSKTYRAYRAAGVDPKDIPVTAEDLFSTNVIDRYAAFRDVDYDPTKVFRLEGFTKSELRAAHGEHSRRLHKLEGRIKKYWGGTVPDNPLEATMLNMYRKSGLSAEDARKLFAQKTQASRHHDYLRRMQAVLELEADHIEKHIGGKVADTAGAFAGVYQIAGIKKSVAGQLDAGEEIFQELQKRVIPGADTTTSVAKISRLLQQLGPDAAASDVFLGLSSDSTVANKETTRMAQQLVYGAKRLQDPTVQSNLALMDLVQGKGKKMTQENVAMLRNLLEGPTPATGHVPVELITRMMGQAAYPEGTPTAGMRAMDAMVTASNADDKAAGAEAKAAGGLARKLWAEVPDGAKGPLKIGGAILGGLVALRAAKSMLAGDEPGIMASSSSAPLPPRPIGVQGGYHQELAPPPPPTFNPPTARVISPMQRGPSVTMSATASPGMNFEGLGDRLAMAAHSPAGPPLAGVFTSGFFDTSRIDMNIENNLRSQNRLYM